MEFERCIDFLVRMIDKYGYEVLRIRQGIFQGILQRHISRYAFWDPCRSYIDGKRRRGIIKEVYIFYY